MRHRFNIRILAFWLKIKKRKIKSKHDSDIWHPMTRLPMIFLIHEQPRKATNCGGCILKFKPREENQINNMQHMDGFINCAFILFIKKNTSRICSTGKPHLTTIKNTLKNNRGSHPSIRYLPSIPRRNFNKNP